MMVDKVRTSAERQSSVRETPPKRKDTLITGKEENIRISRMAMEELGLSRLAKSKSNVPLSFSMVIEVEVKAGLKSATRTSCPSDKTVNKSREAKALKE
jgi:hypothetical protein